MAYRTIKRGKRSYTRKRSTPRSTKRSYAPRRRYTGKRRFTSRKMSNKRILNVTSKKKKDVMRTWTNMDANNTVGNFRAGSAILQGNNTYVIPWAATSRPALSQVGSHGSPVEEAVRTATTCYMRGLKERIQILSDTGAPWKWRRICVRLRGDFLYSKETGTTPLSLLTEDAGMVRLATNWGNNATAINDLFRILFRGERNIDWRDPLIAPTDSRRWDIVYDKTTHITCGNESGVYRTYNRWHAMNKNLVFDDDQDGGDQELRRWSVEGKQGMGDYYVIDFFAGNGGADDQLSVEYNSTLYWHEK